MTLAAHIDFEGASTTDLKKSGVYRYAEDPNTRVWLFSWRIGGEDQPVFRWHPGDPPPVALLDWIRSGGWVVAHNAGFERTIWNKVIRVRYCPDWPELKIEQQTCTMARAASMALPMDLDRLGVVLGTKQQKDAAGSRLMKQMMKPRRVEPDGTIVWWDDADRIARLGDYCDQDVRTEGEADTLLPWLPWPEQQLWQLDQLINDRGVLIDLDFVKLAWDMVSVAQQRADNELAQLTNNQVRKVSDTGGIKAWLNSRGINCETLRKGDQEELIAISSLMDDASAVRVLELRATAGKISVKKFAAFLECVCEDGRVRGLLAFYGAHSGRWAGRLVQPQNFPRVDAETEEVYVQFLYEVIMTATDLVDAFDTIELIGPPKDAAGNRVEGQATLPWLSKALRRCIVAEKGKRLVGGDFSNIEGRVNAWLAGEHWKLIAFREYDEGKGPDLYKVAFGKSFGIDIPDITKPQRQIGKVQELSCGYQGGVGAYVQMTQTYLIKLDKIVAQVEATIDAKTWDEVSAKYLGARDKAGLDQRTWTAIKIVVLGWRSAHPAIVESWWELQDAAIAAIDSPMTYVPVYGGRVHYLSDGNYLYCYLPSGRVLSYAKPFVHTKKTEQIWNGIQWIDTDELFPDEVDQLIALGSKVKVQTRRQACYWGVNENKQWTVIYMYGGYQCENIVQAVSRDIMVAAMWRVEQAGYPLILTVHDELLSEVIKGFGSAQHYGELMSIPQPWTDGLPIAVSAWEDEAYTK